jgi:predicted metal-binding membrane protein
MELMKGVCLVAHGPPWLVSAATLGTAGAYTFSGLNERCRRLVTT